MNDIQIKDSLPKDGRPSFWEAIKAEPTPLLNLAVYIYRRPHMRDESLEYELHMGRNVLDACFDTFKMQPDIQNLSLSFPENWLNIVEQRVLFERLWYYCPNLKNLTIKTQSVYIIQTTPSGFCRIIKPKGSEGDPLPQESDPINHRLWEPMVGNLLDISKLNVICL